MSATTVVVGARLPVADAELFKTHAEHHGLTTSGALGALVKTSIAVVRAGEQAADQKEATHA